MIGRRKFNGRDKTLNDRILHGLKAGQHWESRVECLHRNLIKNKMTQEIQSFELKPMLVGADVISLYPNLDGIAISKMVGNAIRNTKVTFNGINYLFLCVYIFLVLGGEEMDRVGLGECKPKRRKKSEARSLASTMNRDLDHWNFENIEFTEKK